MLRKIILINPYGIICYYVIMFLFQIVITSNFITGSIYNFLYTALGIPTLIILIGWPTLVAKYIAIHSQAINKKEVKKSLYYFYYIFSALIIVFLLNLFWDNLIANIKGGQKGYMFGILYFLVTASVTYAFLRILWIASKALVYTEDGQKVSSSRLIGTFLQFFYLPICIVFLHKRLKRMSNSFDNGD